VAVVVNTHHHPEVTGGNHSFTVDTRVIARPRCKERIPGQMNRYISQVKEFLFREDDAGKARALDLVRRDWLALHKRVADLRPEEFLPTEILDAVSRELDIGGRRVVLRVPAAAAHTDNDIVVHLPDDDILIVGGLVAARRHAEIDRDSGADVRGWQAALAALEPLCGPRTIVVPAEGAPGNVSLLSWQREYLETLWKAVTTVVDRGGSREEVRALRPRLRLPTDVPVDRLIMSLDAVYDDVRAARSAPATPEKRK
jgi:glyoxylase-like metal-dependent hydrolase (beta-lactamase superfamily II)